MNVIEIISRPSPQKLHITEVAFVVKKYVKEKKGISVTIETKPKSKNPFDIAFHMRHIQKLDHAFAKASEYFFNKNN